MYKGYEPSPTGEEVLAEDFPAEQLKVTLQSLRTRKQSEANKRKQYLVDAYRSQKAEDEIDKKILEVEKTLDILEKK